MNQNSDQQTRPSIQTAIESMSSKDAFDAIHAAMDIIAIAVAWNTQRGLDGMLMQIAASLQAATEASPSMSLRAGQDQVLAREIVDLLRGYLAHYALHPATIPEVPTQSHDLP